MSQSPDAALKKLGRVLKGRREELGLSLREVARAANPLTAPYLAILEGGDNPKTGRPSRPSNDLVFRLARVLGLDPRQLLELAGYPSPAGDTYLPSTADILAQRGTPPPAFRALSELETDLPRTLADLGGIVEVPVFTALHHLDQIGDDASTQRDIAIVGRCFRAGKEPPAKLFKLRNNPVPDQTAFLEGDPSELTGTLRIAVMGQFMTPTVLLLRHLRMNQCSCRLINRRQGQDRTLFEEGQPDVEISVVYSAEGQVELLMHGIVDFILSIHPFSEVDQEYTFQEVRLDLWRAFRATELPMNLVVVPASWLKAKASVGRIVSRLDSIGGSHLAYFGSKRERGFYELVPDEERGGTQEQMVPESVLDVFPDPYIPNPAKVFFAHQRFNGQTYQGFAADLSSLVSLGCYVHLLENEREPGWFENWVVPRSDLIDRIAAGERTSPVVPMHRAEGRA